jgi:hypothetical protein
MKKSNNNIDKALGGGKGDGPTLVADKNEHIELDIMNALEEAYKEAVKNGFSGSRQEYQDSLSLGELKRIGAATGGLISGIRMQK